MSAYEKDVKNVLGISIFEQFARKLKKAPLIKLAANILVGRIPADWYQQEMFGKRRQ